MVLDCSRRLDVVNRGLSGYTTSNILKLLPDIIPDPSNSKIDYLVSYVIYVLCGVEIPHYLAELHNSKSRVS